jgi:hypothetical protein
MINQQVSPENNYWGKKKKKKKPSLEIRGNFDRASKQAEDKQNMLIVLKT